MSNNSQVAVLLNTDLDLGFEWTIVLFAAGLYGCTHSARNLLLRYRLKPLLFEHRLAQPIMYYFMLRPWLKTLQVSYLRHHAPRRRDDQYPF